MEARFSGCAVITHWLPHTSVQIFFRFVLVYKKVWCSLSSLSIQSGVLAVTFCTTLLTQEVFKKISIKSLFTIVFFNLPFWKKAMAF